MTSASRTIEGIVTERVLDAGTRSERRSVVLVAAVGVEIPVHVKGDNPFEPATLRALLGRRVRMTGTMRRDTLRAEKQDVTVLDEPASMPGEPSGSVEGHGGAATLEEPAGDVPASEPLPLPAAPEPPRDTGDQE